MASPHRSRSPERRRPAAMLAVVLSLLLVVSACSSGDDGDGGDVDDDGAAQGSESTSTDVEGVDRSEPCPTETEAAEFASAEEMRDLLAEFNGFGLRSPGSDQHEASLDWLADQLAEVPGMEIEWDEYEMDRWEPTSEAEGDTPGRDLAAAGGLNVDDGSGTREMEVIGAVPFSLPTDETGASGSMVCLGPDEPLTPANASGKVVVQEVAPGTIPASVFELIAHHMTDDIAATGDYARPYLRPLDEMLTAAGKADAAGLVILWDAPTDQLRGYWDPHSGTRHHVPSVFVGSDHAQEIRDLAGSGATAEVVVRAEWAEVPTRNLIATLPGETRERIIVNTNTDSVNWVQENGPVAAVAMARYFGSLPVECRSRDIQFALTSNHLGYSGDGTFRYGEQLDQDFDDGTVAFVMALEHLGAREILPVEGAADGELELTGEAEMFAWSAPDESPALVEASVDAVKRRGLNRTIVLEGVGLPSDETVPSICSQGGLGTNFHGILIPTIAGISGPWSLWAPSFGEDAIDFDRMRDQTLAFTDVAIQLDDVPQPEIAGGYIDAREQRAGGATTCEVPRPPAVAPTS